MDEILTIDEIYSRFPSEWVLIDDPEVDAQFEVQRGRVACHSKDRSEVHRVAMEIKPKRSAFLFTGPPVPPGMALLL